MLAKSNAYKLFHTYKSSRDMCRVDSIYDAILEGDLNLILASKIPQKYYLSNFVDTVIYNLYVSVLYKI